MSEIKQSCGQCRCRRQKCRLWTFTCIFSRVRACPQNLRYRCKKFDAFYDDPEKCSVNKLIRQISMNVCLTRTGLKPKDIQPMV
jgi:hypothetical protein